MRLRPSRSTLFPYTTLFRSAVERRGRKTAGEEGRADRCSPGMGRSDAGRDGRSDEVLEGEQEMSQKITSYPGHERSEEHTSELQSPYDLVCRLLLEKKKTNI